MDIEKIDEMMTMAREKGNFNELIRLRKIKDMHSPGYIAPAAIRSFSKKPKAEDEDMRLS